MRVVNNLPIWEGVKTFHFAHLELAWKSRERIPKLYKNLEKDLVSVSILRPMAVSVSVLILRFEKKSLNIGLKIETLKKSLGLSLVVESAAKKSRSWSQFWDQWQSQSRSWDSKKNLVQKNFGFEKNCRSETNLGTKKIWSRSWGSEKKVSVSVS